MEGFRPCLSTVAILAAMLFISVKGQIVTTPCTSSMVTSFTPCINYITGSSGNGASPTASCCDSVKSLMGGSMDCACLLITGNVPLSLPTTISQALALSLPQACKSSVPLQCKASGVPLPPPGPALFGPPISPLSPTPASPFSPRASKAAGLAAAPPENYGTTLEIAPASPPVDAVAPTPKTTPGIRPVVTPTSASSPSYIPSPHTLLICVGIMVFKCY